MHFFSSLEWNNCSFPMSEKVFHCCSPFISQKVFQIIVHMTIIYLSSVGTRKLYYTIVSQQDKARQQTTQEYLINYEISDTVPKCINFQKMQKKKRSLSRVCCFVHLRGKEEKTRDELVGLDQVCMWILDPEPSQNFDY